ncbi:MarR family transcriptional regulator [Pararoseomonas sp. SCSIO 73927]|uniref:MarR family winged helix-turn-helix transcriptional regulator n=1 Tax=Pararoseomonas sp. SCSIO 73927 TaxID=3114537 RepID=UPI0030CFF481
MPRNSIYAPVTEGPAGEAVAFDRYLPTVLSKLVSELRISANAFFGDRYGVTLIEWRILSFLAAAGPSSAYTIWTEGELDKAAVSRALRGLQGREFVTILPGTRTRRPSLVIDLAPAGRRLHDAMFDEIMLRHERLLDGLSPGDAETLFSLLRRVRENIPGMSGGRPLPRD